MVGEDDKAGGEPREDDGQGTGPQDAGHVPVLLNETLQALHLQEGLLVVDGTVGAGGHARAILAGIAPDGQLIGIDQDAEALARAGAVLGQEAASARARYSLHALSYSRMEQALAQEQCAACDRVLLDVGVSSMQLDTPERGFSLRSDGPLDMRMDASRGKSLAQLLTRVTEAELVQIFSEFGEERYSRRIAKAVIEARNRRELHSTLQLAEVVKRAVPRGSGRIHPATRVFQALRIWVNDELGELQRGLEAARRCLRPGGRLVVISFHSLEDRIVKRYLRESGAFDLPFRKPVRPTEAECQTNPRARSARLRCGIKREEVA